MVERQCPGGEWLKDNVRGINSYVICGVSDGQYTTKYTYEKMVDLVQTFQVGSQHNAM